MKAFVIAIAIALTGCALLQPGAEQLGTVDAIIADAMTAARAPSAEQKAALSRAQDAFTRDPTAVSRLRLTAVGSRVKASCARDNAAFCSAEGARAAVMASAMMASTVPNCSAPGCSSAQPVRAIAIAMTKAFMPPPATPARAYAAK